MLQEDKTVDGQKKSLTGTQEIKNDLKDDQI
jgi:hypothetical protein